MTSDRTPPTLDKAPGLTWRPRVKGWEARWQARTDLIDGGFLPKTRRIIRTSWEPTPAEIAYIRDICRKEQARMLVWSRARKMVESINDGTVRVLIRGYETDPDSPFQTARHVSRQNYIYLGKRLMAEHGGKKIKEISPRDVLHWHRQWREASGVPTAHNLISHFRAVLTFGGSILMDQDCRALRAALRDLKFEMGKARETVLTAEHAVAIRRQAHAIGYPSIALAQALQFECTFRQKDVIGEYVPQDDPVPSDVLDNSNRTKWVRGLRWQEIDANMILRHTTSKKGKDVEINLRLAPMVMEELALLDQPLPASGPVIVSEVTGRPFRADNFRRLWRRCATAVGVPKEVWNMDSRAGAITEATDVADLEHARHAATHSNISMTQRYARESTKKIANVMELRAARRNKDGTK